MMKIKEMLYENITRLELLGAIFAFALGEIVGKLWSLA
jgi:hypothetical protein